MKRFILISSYILFFPTIIAFILATIIMWLNRLLGLPFYFYTYGFKKGFKFYLNDNLGATQDIISNFW